MNNGHHLILDLYDCDQEILDDYNYLSDMLRDAVSISGANLIRMCGEHFEPQGVTVLALLSESHASIHTWPCQGYAAVDLYTCNPSGTDSQRAAEFICQKLKCVDSEQKFIERKIAK